MVDISVYRRLFGPDKELQLDAYLTLLAAKDAELERIQRIAEDRHSSKTINSQRCSEGHLAVAALKLRIEMLGLNAPAKIALTDPTGREGLGLTPAQLQKIALDAAAELGDIHVSPK